MSARNIFALALVAIVVVQANSFPYAAKGGQFEQEPIKAQPQPTQLTPSEQLFSTQSAQQTTTATMTQMETAPVKQLYGAPAQAAQTLVGSVPTPVKATVETMPAVPTVSTSLPVKGQAPYQQPAQVYSSKGGYQSSYQQEQRLESAPLQPTVSQTPAAEPVSFVAPSKSQSFTQQSNQVYSSKSGPQTFYQQAERLPVRQFEPAPLKGAQVHHATKAQWTAPVRQEVLAVQHELPSKGYHYRQRQFLRSPLRGSYLQQTQQLVARPLFGQSPLRA